MRVRLRTRVALFVTILVLGASALGTGVLVLVLGRTGSREIAARGTTLAQSLALAADEGVAAEDLDLLRRAAHVVRADDVVLVSVYSSTWSPIDAYPFERLRDPPTPAAVAHFAAGEGPFQEHDGDRHDFYVPIRFSAPGLPEVTIGYGRVALVPAALRRSIRLVALGGILASLALTIVVVVVSNAFAERLIVAPIVELHRDVARFRDGHLPASAAGRAVDEIVELREEFRAMGVAVREGEERLVRQNEELKALDRLKDALIRDVTHELKTPVAKQAMQLEMLRRFLGADCLRSVEETLGAMERSVHRQAQVIRNLLDLSRLESGGRRYAIEPLRLDELAREVIEDYRFHAGSAGVQLEAELEPVTALGDREMLWHVVSNLVSNALKFQEPGRPGPVRVAVGREDGGAVVRVSGPGVGLTPEELGRAFEKFYQGTASIEGAGVGLSIAKRIAEELGGSIALASPGRGRGATATVRLPLAPP